jgi:hypothetical protein
MPLRKRVLVTVAIIIFIFVTVTAIVGADSGITAAEFVNRECAVHGGIESWGGEEAYEATCRNGIGVQGDDESHWDWPW